MERKTLSKAELAMRYAPELTPHSAVNRLMAWIRLNPTLTEALAAAHYHTRQKVLTARQVALIVEHLGEP